MPFHTDALNRPICCQVHLWHCSLPISDGLPCFSNCKKARHAHAAIIKQRDDNPFVLKPNKPRISCLTFTGRIELSIGRGSQLWDNVACLAV